MVRWRGTCDVYGRGGPDRCEAGLGQAAHIDVAEALQQVASDEPEAQRDHASESGERRVVTGAKSVPSTHRALHAPIWPRSIGVIS
eukprot:scaffold20025_cov149-Isochrysis_galbana.AAC.2